MPPLRSRFELGGERVGVGGGESASIVAAHVGGLSIAALPQRGVVGLAVGEHGGREMTVLHHPDEVGTVAGDDDLGHAAVVQVERLEQHPEASGRLGREAAGQAQDRLAPLPVPGLAAQRGQAQQRDGSGRVGRRQGVVLEVLVAGDELLAVAAGREHAAVGVVPEQREELHPPPPWPRRSSGRPRWPRPGGRTRRPARRGPRRRRASWRRRRLAMTAATGRRRGGGSRRGTRRTRPPRRASLPGRTHRPPRRARRSSARSTRSAPCRRAPAAPGWPGARRAGAGPPRRAAGGPSRRGGGAAPGSTSPRSWPAGRARSG